MSPIMTVLAGRHSRLVLFVLSVVLTVFTIVGMAVGLFQVTWRGPMLVLTAVTWIVYLGASVHYTVSETIRLRMDRIQDELSEQDSANLHEIESLIVRKFNQTELLRNVLHELDRRYEPTRLTGGDGATSGESVPPSPDGTPAPRSQPDVAGPPKVSQ